MNREDAPAERPPVARRAYKTGSVTTPVVEPAPVVPDYGGACVDSLLRALAARPHCPPWVPEPVTRARQLVLLVLDGLGWDQLRARTKLAPTLSGMVGGAITTVVPSTTSAALTSITTGSTPGIHGLTGHRLVVPGQGVLDCLRWTVARSDAREAVPPESWQPVTPFAGTDPVVVTRAGFADTGFTVAHLRGGRLRGWKVPSTLAVEVGRALAEAEPFVYAYYDGIDLVAHQCGLDDRYDAELTAVDRLVADLLEALPPGAALAVTADHGHIDVGDAVTMLDGDLVRACTVVSGEARFRWLTARPGGQSELLDECRRRYGHLAWVRSRDEVEAAGWLGPRLVPGVAARLGDVVLAPHAPTAFIEGPRHPVSHHGSLTRGEVLVPLLGGAR